MSRAWSAIDDRCPTVAQPAADSPEDKYNGPREGKWEVRSGAGSFVDDRCPTVYNYAPAARGPDDAQIRGGIFEKLAQDRAWQKAKQAKAMDNDDSSSDEREQERTTPASKTFKIRKAAKMNAVQQAATKTKEKAMSVEDLAERMGDAAVAAAKTYTIGKQRKSKGNKGMVQQQQKPAETADEPGRRGLRIVDKTGEECFVEMSAGAMDFIKKSALDAEAEKVHSRTSSRVPSKVARAAASKRGKLSRLGVRSMAEFPPVKQDEVPALAVRQATASPGARPSSRQAQRSRPVSSKASTKRSKKSDAGDTVSHLWQDADHFYVPERGKPMQSIEQVGRSCQPSVQDGDSPASMRSKAVSDLAASASRSHRRSTPGNYIGEQFMYMPGSAAAASRAKTHSSRPVTHRTSRSASQHWEPASEYKTATKHTPSAQASVRSASRHTAQQTSQLPVSSHHSVAWDQGDAVHMSIQVPSQHATPSARSQVRSSPQAQSSGTESLHLPLNLFHSTDTHSTVRSADELRIDAQRALQTYRYEPGQPTVPAGSGWVSPHPLSVAPTSLRSDLDTHVTLPAYDDKEAARLTHAEFVRLQDIYAEDVCNPWAGSDDWVYVAGEQVSQEGSVRGSGRSRGRSTVHLRMPWD